MPLTRTRYFIPGILLAYAAFAAVVAGGAASGAGLVVLVVGIFVALIVDHARWHAEEKDRTTLTAPFRPDPYGLRRADPPEAAAGDPPGADATGSDGTEPRAARAYAGSPAGA